MFRHPVFVKTQESYIVRLPGENALAMRHVKATERTLLGRGPKRLSFVQYQVKYCCVGLPVCWFLGGVLHGFEENDCNNAATSDTSVPITV